MCLGRGGRDDAEAGSRSQFPGALNAELRSLVFYPEGSGELLEVCKQVQVSSEPWTSSFALFHSIMPTLKSLAWRPQMPTAERSLLSCAGPRLHHSEQVAV